MCLHAHSLLLQGLLAVGSGSCCSEFPIREVIISVFIFFIFVGAPLNQTAQSLLPPLLDAGDTERTRKTGANILGIAFTVAVVTATICSALSP